MHILWVANLFKKGCVSMQGLFKNQDPLSSSNVWCGWMTSRIVKKSRRSFNDFLHEQKKNLPWHYVCLCYYINRSSVQNMLEFGVFHLTREIFQFFRFTLLPHMHMRAFPSLTLIKIPLTCNIFMRVREGNYRIWICANSLPSLS